MKVNIYYGGRGLIEDPTLYVINKLSEVLTELRVTVQRYNLYEEKNQIAMLSKTLKEADGVILATTIEWYGIGGFMQQFLDACWMYGDKEHLSKLYMLPVVMSTACWEREGELFLTKSWEMLGGIPCAGLKAYIEDQTDFETNSTYGLLIEKQAELFYKTINQKSKMLPTSHSIIRSNILKGNTNDLSPQENEQLSMYVSDDSYVKKQKEDIEELSQIFKGMLDGSQGEKEEDLLPKIKANFTPKNENDVSFSITFNESGKNLIIEVVNKNLNCYFGDKSDADTFIKGSFSTIKKITQGVTTLQKAFMSGDLTAKGNFAVIGVFDQIFPFAK
ncbi:MAG: SCP2 sterol-binding domain-containing protein [Anaerocolumna sp.]